MGACEVTPTQIVGGGSKRAVVCKTHMDDACPWISQGGGRLRRGVDTLYVTMPMTPLPLPCSWDDAICEPVDNGTWLTLSRG